MDECGIYILEKLKVKGFMNEPMVNEGHLVDIVTNVVTITPEDSLAEALRVMSGKGIGRLPVVEKKGSRKLVGIIARADIGRAIRERSA